MSIIVDVSKLFRAYGLYNLLKNFSSISSSGFQSSFELTGYITSPSVLSEGRCLFQSSFELTGYIT